MTPFDGHRVSFGRHETFPLRFGWLTKGYREWCANTNVFEEDDATIALGVGKNMVAAIRYWLIAAGVVSVEDKALKPTEFGRRVFADEGWDPYLEDDATIWTLHWRLASSPEKATSVFWFFNRFHKPEFSGSELLRNLGEFCRESVLSKVAPATIKHDASLLLRMYERSRQERGAPIEETLDSPFALLGLVQPLSESRQMHQSVPESRGQLPVAAFGYAVAELFEYAQQPALPVDRIVRSDGLTAAPGAVFRLTEDGTMRKLEELVAWLPQSFELREAAGIRQLYRLDGRPPMDLLQSHYETATRSEQIA